MSAITAQRYHDISCGHRVAGHESKCAHLHGHNYRITFVCAAEDYENAPVDGLGRVIDFSAIKEHLCMWVENCWDHKFLAWKDDELMRSIAASVSVADKPRESAVPLHADVMLADSIIWTPFNPTAENMAAYLLNVIGPEQLAGTGVKLISVEVEETRKCSATVSIGRLR